MWIVRQLIWTKKEIIIWVIASGWISGISEVTMSVDKDIWMEMMVFTGRWEVKFFDEKGYAKPMIFLRICGRYDRYQIRNAMSTWHVDGICVDEWLLCMGKQVTMWKWVLTLTFPAAIIIVIVIIIVIIVIIAFVSLTVGIIWGYSIRRWFVNRFHVLLYELLVKINFPKNEDILAFGLMLNGCNSIKLKCLLLALYKWGWLYPLWVETTYLVPSHSNPLSGNPSGATAWGKYFFTKLSRTFTVHSSSSPWIFVISASLL
jgi:hypothetical protein